MAEKRFGIGIGLDKRTGEVSFCDSSGLRKGEGCYDCILKIPDHDELELSSAEKLMSMNRDCNDFITKDLKKQTNSFEKGIETMKKSFKRLIVGIVVVMMVFAVCSTGFAYSTGTYNGSCTNTFTCSQTWNKINDDILENRNTYARLYHSDESGTECAFTSRCAVGSHTKDKLTSSRNTVTWNNSYQGTCKLTIVNSYYSGTRLYVKGFFNLYDEDEA